MQSQKKTSRMISQLNSINDFEHFVEDHKDDFVRVSLTDHIQKIIDEKGLSKAEVIRAADLDRVYGYQILCGRRAPTREKLIQLSFGLKLDLDETQSLLKVAGLAPLYARIKREAAIIFCKNHRYDLMETQSFLQKTQVRIIGE